MTDDSEDYRRGLLEGRMSALEDRHSKTEGRVDVIDGRVTAQERITYSLIGALVFIQVWPTIEGLMR
jgi:hypothetical protein